MANSDYQMTHVVDYGQYNNTTSWNGGVCFRCGINYVGTHICSGYWPVVPTYVPSVVTYVPSVVSPEVTELMAEVKKLRKELRRGRKAQSRDV